MGCSKCNVDFNNQKEVVKCAECMSEFHVTCCRIRTAAKLAHMSAKVLAAWRCDDCAQETTSAASRSDTDDSTILDMLQAINREIADSNKTNKASFASLEKTMSTVQGSIKELKDKLATIETDNSNLKKDCAILRHENKTLKEDVKNLQREVSEIQQYSRVNNVEIRGVPVTANEDIHCVLTSVARAIGVDYNRQEISIAHRLPAPKNKRFHASIVVQFVSRSTKTAWISAAKNKKPNTVDLSTSFAKGPVFVGDHLTTHNKEILSWAKTYIQAGRLAYVWSRDGKIFIRATTVSPAIRVWTKDDVFKALVPGPSEQLHSDANSVKDGTGKISAK